MKRYEGYVKVYWLQGAKVEMKEELKGEWVKWEDVPTWISVDDKMPDKDALYLTYAPSSDTRKPLIQCAWYSLDAPGWSGLASIWLTAITHWMPLPVSPVLREEE